MTVSKKKISQFYAKSLLFQNCQDFDAVYPGDEFQRESCRKTLLLSIAAWLAKLEKRRSAERFKTPARPTPRVLNREKVLPL